MKCTVCGTEFQDRICPKCGAPALHVTKCPECGEPIPDYAMEFCPHCGAALPTVPVLSGEKAERAQASLLYDDAVQCVCDAGYAKTSLLQRRLKVGYAVAARLMDQMELNGVIGPYRGDQPREVLIPHKTDPALPYSPPSAPEVTASNSKPASSQSYPVQSSEGISLSDCDAMEGHDFEYLCAAILQVNGFVNVTVTKASGDQGIDVLAEKSGSRYAIQCKCYDSPVGNHAVQEAYAGAAFYDGRIPVVITNQIFTASAQSLAARIKVTLWDRYELERMLAIYNNAVHGIPIPQFSYSPQRNQRSGRVVRGPRNVRLCKKWVTFFLCLFFGFFGFHKFYEGKIGMGVLYLFTMGLCGIGWLVDLFAILKKPPRYPAR